MNDEHHQEALLEDINDKLDHLAEGMSVLSDGIQEVRRVVADVPEIKDDIKAIKAAVTDQSRQLSKVEHQVADHDNRIRTVESAA